MLNLDEVERAIAELEELPNHTVKMCSRLADLYSIRDHMLEDIPTSYVQRYSQTAAPISNTVLTRYGDSDFLRAVDGKDAEAAWTVIDGLMDTLRIVNSRVYESYLRKMQQL